VDPSEFRLVDDQNSMSARKKGQIPSQRGRDNMMREWACCRGLCVSDTFNALSRTRAQLGWPRADGLESAWEGPMRSETLMGGYKRLVVSWWLASPSLVWHPPKHCVLVRRTEAPKRQLHPPQPRSPPRRARLRSIKRGHASGANHGGYPGTDDGASERSAQRGAKSGRQKAGDATPLNASDCIQD